MILKFCLLTLLVVTNTGALRQRRAIKGGPRIQAPHIHLGKGGGGGAALHHTAVVTDPVSLNPVVVEKVTSLGSSGGIKTSGLGPSSGQFSIADSQISSFGARRLYRVGASQVPYGLSGLDYYSYPRSLLSGGSLGGRKTILTDNLSGLSPIGFGGRKSAIIADPGTSQFTVGDSQISSSPFGGGSLYRSGISSVPYGLSGLDYYSYPNVLLSGGGSLGSGLGQTKILSGGGFTSGDAQVGGLISGPIGQEKVIVESAPTIVQAAQEPEQITTIVEDGGFGQRQVTTVSRSSGGLGGLGGLRGGQIILRGGPAAGLRRVKSRPIIQAAAPVEDVQVLVDATSGLGAPIGGFGQRQVVAKTVASAPVFAAPAPIVQVSAPAQVVQAPVFATPIRRRLGEAFLTQAARPLVAARRVATLARPIAVSQPAVTLVQQTPPFPGNIGNIQFTLGNTQIIGGHSLAPAAVVSAPRQVVVQRPAIYQQAPVVTRPVVAIQRPVVAVKQPQVLSQVKTSGGFGARRVFGRQIPQMVYVDGGSRFPGIDIIGGYRIGDPRHNYARLPISTSRFANLGLSQGSIDAGPILVAPAPSPVFGTKNPVGKTLVQANPLGLSGIGHTSPAKVVTQEEVIGPAGDRQVVTTVTDAGPSKIGGLAAGGPLGLTAVGQTGGTKTITQEEVIGPAGDSQILTTITKSGPSKIGGLAAGGPLGLTAVGQTGGTKTITQEEVIGPAGDSQILTTVTKSGPSKIGGAALGGSLGLTAVGQSAPSQVVTQEEVIGPSGDSQIVTTVTNTGPSKIGGPVISSPLGLAGIGKTSPAKIVTQEEVIGPAGDSQIVTTVRDAGPSKIGGAALGGPLGLTGIGQSGVTKTVTQEEVVGPSGDIQQITTVTETASSPSKIGGQVLSSPLGLTAVGQAPTKVITQEEVVGPSGDTQVITTVSETSQPNIVQQEEVVGLSSLTASPLSQEISQDPIESAITQETLGDSGLISSGGAALSPFSQSSIDSGIGSGIGSGLTQLNIDDGFGSSTGSGIGSGLTQLNIDDGFGSSAGSVVKETTYTEQGGVLSDGSIGTTVTKVTEVSQQPIGADPIVQESISSGFGGGLGGYAPRVSFLSQHPYDVPSRALLRQSLARPIVQEQQQLEQILV